MKEIIRIIALLIAGAALLLITCFVLSSSAAVREEIEPPPTKAIELEVYRDCSIEYWNSLTVPERIELINSIADEYLKEYPGCKLIHIDRLVNKETKTVNFYVGCHEEVEK